MALKETEIAELREAANTWMMVIISSSADQSRKLALKHVAMMCQKSMVDPGVCALCDDGAVLTDDELVNVYHCHLDAGDVLLSADTLHWFAGATSSASKSSNFSLSGNRMTSDTLNMCV